MQKNDLFELLITDMGTAGEGIGHYDGLTFFVKDALIGDEIVARVTKLKKNYGYARVEEIINPSTFRVEPKCDLHRRCGGCQIQALDYDKQLEFKNEKVRNNLKRLGGFSDELLDSIMLPVIGMEDPFRYRNKAQFPVGTGKDGLPQMGFYATRSHNIIPVCDCFLGVEDNQYVLLAVKNWMISNKIKAYDEASGKGLVRHVLIRKGFTTNELMVCLIVNANKIPAQMELIDALRKIDGVKSISININKKNTNKILGEETLCLWGESYITDYISLRECPSESELLQMKKDGIVSIRDKYSKTDMAIAYNISPQSFYQVNPVQTEKLYSTALEFAGLTGEEYVWDLYCGIGTISLFLSQKAKKVYGVEIIPQAIEDARNNAKINNITNAEFFVGKAEEVLPDFYENAKKELQAEGSDSVDAKMLTPDVIVVDPPRKGCDERCLETMLTMQPEKIVYVSCDSATLARDLKILCEDGYELKKVQAVDQFGHTLHVETVCLLINQNASAKHHVNVGIDAEDYYKIKEGK